MPPQQTLNEKVAEYKKDLDHIEDLLEQIKREYDLYFVGVRKRQPFEMRSQIERLLRKWRSSTIQKVEYTFRLTTLNSKYNSMVDVWEKIMKRREVDPRALSAYGPTTAQLAAEQASSNRAKEAADAQAASGGAQAAQAARTQAAGASNDPDARLRRVFDQYVDAKKDLGESTETLSYAKFKAQLEKQVETIRQKTQCKDVDFGVTRKDGKVSLTARPVKE